MKYQVANNIFYRRYDDKVVLYDTSKQTVSIHTSVCKDILDAFSTEISVNECIDYLKSVYLEISDEAVKDIEEYIQVLVNTGVLVKENVLAEDKNQIESYVKFDVIPENQLYSVQFELTFRCNEHCKHCYCVDSEVPEGSEELTLDEIKKILDDLYEMNALDLTFTGGELFMRKDVWEILEYASSKRFIINIFSNGNLMTDSDIIRIHNLYPRSVHFSIYSSVPEKHDAFTGVKGSFEKTVDAIKKLVLLGTPVNIKTNAMDYNKDEFEDILLLAKNLGTTIQISMSITAKNDGGTEPFDYRLKEVSDYVDVMKTAQNNIVVNCSEGLEILRDDEGQICGAGSHSLSVDPYGNVYACNSLLISCGNLRETSIRDIWENSEQLKKIRKFNTKDIEGCKDCPDLKYCTFCPGSAFTEVGNPLKKYSEACTIMAAKRLLNEKR